MKYKIQRVIANLAAILESALALLLLIAAAISIVGIAVNLNVGGLMGDSSTLSQYLYTVATIALCVEFVGMLCSHTVDSVVEVVLVAIARQIVVSHGVAWETLMMVVAIAILFVVRKYLFIHALDSSHLKTHSLFVDTVKSVLGQNTDEEAEADEDAERGEKPEIAKKENEQECAG